MFTEAEPSVNLYSVAKKEYEVCEKKFSPRRIRRGTEEGHKRIINLGFEISNLYLSSVLLRALYGESSQPHPFEDC
jgi:hypothetical protein